MTNNDSYQWPFPSSNISWPLPEGAPVYVQVDSANIYTSYGAVWENHEITGGGYNNIAATTVPAVSGASEPSIDVEPAVDTGQSSVPAGNMPVRP